MRERPRNMLSSLARQLFAKVQRRGDAIRIFNYESSVFNYGATRYLIIKLHCFFVVAQSHPRIGGATG